MYKISHEDYLKQKLASNNLKIEKLNFQHQVDIAKYETKTRMLREEIHSIERQLGQESKND